MTSTTYNLVKAFQFDANHSGAHYSFDGGSHWCNFGEFAETHFKACLNLKAEKDANTPFDKGDDIPEYSASVKSSKATLVNRVLGNSFEETKALYFENVHSKRFVWVSIQDTELTAFWMDASEFENFLNEFSSFDKSRKVIRFKAESKRMIQWLKEKS